jgi:type I restriction enzyme R subunit
LIEEDLKNYLLNRYAKEQLTEIEAHSIILQLKTLSSAAMGLQIYRYYGLCHI